MNYWQCGEPHDWARPKQSYYILDMLRISKLCSEADPHFGLSPYRRIGPPGRIPDDRFHLLPEWKDCYNYAMECNRCPIMI